MAQWFWESCNLICVNLIKENYIKVLLLLSSDFRFHMQLFRLQMYFMPYYMMWCISYIFIILPQRLLHSLFFSSRFLFCRENLHAICCTATFSVRICEFTVLKHFGRAVKFLHIGWDFFWLLLFTQLDSSQPSLCISGDNNWTPILHFF